MPYVVVSLRHQVRRPALRMSGDGAGRALWGPVATGDKGPVVSDELPAERLERRQLTPEVAQVAVDFFQRAID